MRLINEKEMRTRVGGLSRTKIWELERQGKFPKAVQITEKRKGYVDEEIDAWVKARIAARDARAA